MLEPRTIFLFSTSAFNTSEQRSYFLNPCCFGDDVAQALMNGLRARGLQRLDGPHQEDFGWYFDFAVEGMGHRLLVGYRPGSGSDHGVWIGEVERTRHGWTAIFGRWRIPVAPGALSLVHAAVSELPQLSTLAWHEKRRFDAGDESRGAETPIQTSSR